MENQNSMDKSAKDLKDSGKAFFGELFNIQRDTNEENSIATIRDAISMKGSNAWILIFSIFVASIGLNANSTAVVIGAMLISPLMGPILGIGLSIGINDADMLKRALSNLGVMVALSLLTSFLYFSVPLFQEETTEILARVRPDVRDVLIALSGGLALIVAITRPNPQTNIVAGVAIATALMPPLCVAGYGLALGNMNYFFGAMFLFTINSIFIAIATFSIVRYLRFSLVRYIDQAKRKNISRFASIVAIVVAAGSIFSFFQLVKEKQYTNSAKHFIDELKYDGYSILGNADEAIDYNEKTITLQLLEIPNTETKQIWETRIADRGLNAELIVKGGDDSDIRQQVESLQDLYSQNQKIITSRDESIKEKDEKILLLQQQLTKYQNSLVDFQTISEEAKINYPELNELAYSRQIKTNFNSIDTLTVIHTLWEKDLKDDKIETEEAKLSQWLKKRMAVDTLVLSRN